MILQPEHNCQEICSASRFSLLVDGQAYFAAFHDCLYKAKQRVLLAGWDFHSRVALLRDNSGPDQSTQLRTALDDAARRRPNLQIHVLAWDYAMLYALEREPLAVFNFAWRSGNRVRLHMDGEHPFGASHHQKISVVDDRLGFVGGLDLTQHRWDTPQHKPGDPRREAPTGVHYPPFHDVMGLVDGEAARALGNLVRRRWQLATGDELQAPNHAEDNGDLWPDGVEPDLRDVTVGLARTEPAYKGRPEVREIENLYVDAIATAKECIYIENQYLTASRVVDALAERLAGESPPEVVAVLPRHCSGWLEEQVMHSLRADAVSRLQQADRQDRFRVFYPATGDDQEPAIKVHAKCLFVDDHFLTLGSANISNRSMGLDTECNLALEMDASEGRQGLRRLRLRLLAEHMGRDVDEVAEALDNHGSMLEVISRLNSGQRHLAPLEKEIAEDGKAMNDVPVELVRRLDPEQPVAFDKLLDEVAEESPEVQRGPGQLTLALSLLLLCALAVGWRHSPWGSQAAAVDIAGWLAALRAMPVMPFALLGLYAVSGVALIPATLLIALTMLVYPLPEAPVWAMTGCLLGGLSGYIWGRWRGSAYLRTKPHPGLNRLGRLLASDTMASLAMMRLVPVAPFWLVNLAAGASHIHLGRYLAGTLLGMAPGILTLAVFAAGIKQAMLSPSWGLAGALLLMSGAMVAGMALLSRRLQPRRASTSGQETRA